MNLKKITRSIISVSDKSNLKILLPILKKFNIKILSSGSTYKKIRSMNYYCTKISNYTGSSEILGGRVKTLHPKIHGGILNIRKNKNHRREMKKMNISNIDLVIVDLYPFEKQIKRKNKFEKLIEYIDIGGFTLLRSAAKNFADVTVISDISDYVKLSKELKNYKGSTSIKFRKLMSAKTFGLTAYYDSLISNYLNTELNIKFPERKTIQGKLMEKLRYGENPHQKGILYRIDKSIGLEKLSGKDLSYNNYNDIYSSLEILKHFKKNEGTAIIKHANPCGVSCEKNQYTSFKNAFMSDPVSAFGGVVAINSTISKKLASNLNKFFFEVIIARGFAKEALKVLKKRKNTRLINCSKYNFDDSNQYLFLKNSFIVQDSNSILFKKKLRIVTKKKPSINQLRSLKFAFNVCKFVKSNAIVIVNDRSTIGIGSGQPSRLDSCKIATNKALKFMPGKLVNCVAASDAFFPFQDGVEELIKAGVTAIIHPGGSINDKKIIKTADKAGIVIALTGIRHFKH